MPETQIQRKNIPFGERRACHAYAASVWAAILRFRATTADAAHSCNTLARLHGEENDGTRNANRDEKDRMGCCSFIYKLITNAVYSQNILRFTGFDLNLTANILDMCIDGTLIRFECDAVDRIQ